MYLALKKYVVQKTFNERYERSSDKTDLIHFRFSFDDVELIRWEHDREFEYEGQMYDVIEECRDGDSLDLWCWRDHQETLLGIRIKTLFKRCAGPEDNPLQRVKWVDWQEVKYLNDPMKVTQPFTTIELYTFSGSANHDHQIYTDPPVPPPRS